MTLLLSKFTANVALTLLKRLLLSFPFYGFIHTTIKAFAFLVLSHSPVHPADT